VPRWWLSRRHHGDVLLIYPDVGASFALIAMSRWRSWFRSVYGAFAAHHRCWSRPPRPDPAASLKSVASTRSICWWSSSRHAPVRVDVMDTTFAQRRRRDLIVAGVSGGHRSTGAAVRESVYVQNIMVLTLMYAALSQS